MDELLILHGPNRQKVRENLGRSLHVVQEVSPYVVIVSEDANTIKDFADKAKDTVWVASKLDLQDHALVDRELTPAEHLFVDAWRQRPKPSEIKNRIGDGLSWSARGFKAP